MTLIDRRALLASAGAFGAASLGACVAWAHKGDAAVAEPGSWTARAAMPFPVQEIYPAPYLDLGDGPATLKPSAANVLINAGGLAPSEPFGVTDAVTVYDPVRDEWRFTSALPRPRHHIALVNNNGFLYAVGGFARDANGGWQMREDCWRLDGLGEKWRPIQSLPHPQAEAVCASLKGLIHVVGGRAPAGSMNAEWAHHIDTDEHWIYDPVQDDWFVAASLPTPRNSSAGAVVKGVLYVIGGRTVSDGNLATVEVYDPLSDRWNTARPMPQAQGGLAAAVLDHKIYVFGGEYFNAAGGGVYVQSWEYDPGEDKWRAVAPMPRPRHGLGAVTLGDAIYVVGGAALPGVEAVSSAVDRFSI